jgi:hypothetical protein
MPANDVTPLGIDLQHAPTRRRSALDTLAGLTAIATALALWGWVVAGVMAPLGSALSRVAGEATPLPAVEAAPCGVPPGALAYAARPAGAAARPACP